jgi:hypothetical protein
MKLREGGSSITTPIDAQRHKNFAKGNFLPYSLLFISIRIRILFIVL